MKLIPSEHLLATTQLPTPIKTKKRSETVAVNRDLRMVKSTCFKMLQYSSSGGNMSIQELNELNLDLERSILAIQRRKKKLIEKRSKRKV